MVDITHPTNRFGVYNGSGTAPQGEALISLHGEPGRYLADHELVIAVNTALAIEQPLLVTGEPGTGKSALAWSIASELGLGEPLPFYTRSDSHARDLLYVYDYLPRYLDAQLRSENAFDATRYVRFVALGEAICSNRRRVVLIDEIDKAPRDFANDLLEQLDHMAFSIPETGITYTSKYRPIVVITSNSERQLPDPFLRRCIFHHIEFPSADRLRGILQERLSHLRVTEHLLDISVRKFLQLRELRHLDKLPATSELLTWVRALLAAGIDARQVEASPLRELPLINALVKTRSDRSLLSSLTDS